MAIPRELLLATLSRGRESGGCKHAHGVSKHEAGSPSRDKASMTSTIDEADDLEASSIFSHPALEGKEKQSIDILSRTLSRVRSGPPSNGGRMAWLQVALAQLTICNAYYEQSNQKICLSSWHE
jgi:hypothetical protein